MHVINVYLPNIPLYEKAVDLGRKWIITLWKASRHDVWCSGDMWLISFKNVVFEIRSMIPSLAFVSIEYDEHLKVLFQLSEGFYKKW